MNFVKLVAGYVICLLIYKATKWHPSNDCIMAFLTSFAVLYTSKERQKG